MTIETLRMCHEVLRQVPAGSAQQAVALARALAELEAEVQTAQSAPARPTLVQPVTTAGPSGDTTVA